MNLPINGSEILLLWIGGRVFGLMRGLLLGCPGIPVIAFSPNGKSGRLMSLYFMTWGLVDDRITCNLR